VLVLEQGRLVEDGPFDALATDGRVLPKLLA
jgi:ABC-type multidrug transport system fused ATPase/permease subunit